MSSEETGISSFAEEYVEALEQSVGFNAFHYEELRIIEEALNLQMQFLDTFDEYQAKREQEAVNHLLQMLKPLLAERKE